MTLVQKSKYSLLLLLCAGANTANAQSCDNLRDAGDVLTWALPLAAAGVTALKWDGEGALQLTRTIVFTGAAAGTFKQIGDKTRPDAGTSRQSFVSGHSAGAFMGASYLQTRYGKWYGIPAYSLAILTAYSRTCAQKHFQDDVLGGAMVAMFSNWYSTSPYPDSGRIYPSFTSNGIEWSFSGFFDGNRKPREPENFRARYRTTFEFGSVVQDKNLVIAKPGDEIDLASLEAEFHMTARLHWEKFVLDTKHEFAIWYGPMGMTDFGDPTEPFTVAGVTFDPSDPDAEIYDTNYRWWDLRGTYKYRLVDNDRWTFKVGLGLQYTVTDFEVEQRDADENITLSAGTDDWSLGPTVHLSGALKFTDRWQIDAEFDGMALTGDDYYYNAGLWLRFKPTQIWDLAIGGRMIDGGIDSDKIFNEVRVSDFAFQIGRSF